MVNRGSDDRPIVVGVDDSHGAHYALRWAIGEAVVHASQLEVVHAWEPPAPISGIGSIVAPLDAEPYERAAKQLLEDCISDALASAGEDRPNVVPTLVRGYTTTELLDVAGHAQLLVVGSRGRGGFRGLLLGSVSQHCSRHATVPVAVVPEAAALSPRGEVVIGVDGSPEAAAALRWAVAEAARRGAKLVVIHAWQFNAATAPADYRYAAINWTTFSEQSHELVRQQVVEALAAVGASPISVDRVSSNQPPVQALVGRAGSDGLLVVGSRGRGGFAGLLLGSVSQHCLHHAHGTVVVVPHSYEGSAT